MIYKNGLIFREDIGFVKGGFEVSGDKFARVWTDGEHTCGEHTCGEHIDCGARHVDNACLDKACANAERSGNRQNRQDSQDSANQQEVDLEGMRVIPGLIDIHIHGSKGADFSDGDIEGLETISEYLASRGVTSFLPTSMTLPYDEFAKAFRAAKEFAKAFRAAKLEMGMIPTA